MAAQEQTERATPAPAAAPAAPKLYIKGTVKQVLDGGAVVIRGPPKGGPPPEKTLALTNINAPRLARRPNNALPDGGADEPYAWEAREFLRKLVVGKTVCATVVHSTATREYGVLLLGDDPNTGVDVALRLVEEGLASVRDNCHDEALQQAESSAKAAGKGLHGEGASNHVRKITWDLGEGGGLKLVEQHKGKPIQAVVEHVRDGTTLRAFLLPEMIHITLQMSGVRSPQTKLGPEGKPDPKLCEPYAVEAHYFTESRLLQRDVEIVLESHSYNALNKNTTMVGSVNHPAGNIAEALLKEGMAKCVDWSISKVTGGPEKYRAAEKLAKERRMRIWKEFKPSENTLSDKEREYTGKVVEVVNGDALMVKAGGKVRKIHLASLRPPRQEGDVAANRGKDFRPLYDVPFMFEAREFLRKKLIGHQVQVTVDYVQPARVEPGQGAFPEKYCCTVVIGGVNVAEALVSKGLATVVRYAADNDMRSGKYDELLQAEEKAKKTGKGLHDKKNTPTHRVSDMTGKLDKCKQFLPFLKRAGRMQGLVEYVASGSRFRIYIPRETCIITFLLGGISCPKGARVMPDGTKVDAEAFGDECALHVKEMILQREVEIEVESQDKAGNFIGYLFCEGTNLSIHLVTEGYASMHFTADRSNYCNQITNAEDNAKAAKKRIWANYVEEADPVAIEEIDKKEMDAERKVSLTEVYVSEVMDDCRFYACNISDGPALETLMENLRTEFVTNPPLAGAYTPKKGDICAAKFVDDQWYRAKVEKMGTTDVAVLYIDYGNRASVPKTKLGSLPASFTAVSGYAKPYSLALTALPQDEELAAQGAQVLKEDILDRKVGINVEYKTGGETFVSVHIDDEDVGKNLVEDGLLLVERKGGRKLEKLVKAYDEAMQKAKKNHLNIWQYGDITQDDSREFGAPAPKPQR